jgi:hypothetical protein
VKSNDPKKKKGKSPSNEDTEMKTKRENEIERIQNQLYPDGKTYDDDEVGELPGYKLIQSIMTAKSSELNHFGMFETLGCNLELVGIGSFGIVFSEPEKEYVIKMSKVGRTDFLRNEAAALSILGRDDNENKNEKDPGGRAFLPKLESYGYYNLSIGQGTHFKMPSLTIGPKAKSLALYLNERKDPSEKLGILIKSFLDYADGLHFMHERGLAHLDVATTNMLVHIKGGLLLRGLLVDLSASRKLKEPIIRFVGNVLFAHSDIHRNGEWHAEAFHDFASLGFVLAALCAEIVNNGRPMWRASVGTYECEEGAEARREIAIFFIDNYLGKNHDYLLCDETKTRLRSYCKSKGIDVKESDNPVVWFQVLGKSWVKQDEISVFEESEQYKVDNKVQPLRETTEYEMVGFDKSNQRRSVD